RFEHPAGGGSIDGRRARRFAVGGEGETRAALQRKKSPADAGPFTRREKVGDSYGISPSIVIVGPDYSADLTARAEGRVNVCVRRARAEGSDHFGELAGGDPLRCLGYDVGSSQRSRDRRGGRRAGLRQWHAGRRREVRAQEQD